jgi:HEAT repeat protein
VTTLEQLLKNLYHPDIHVREASEKELGQAGAAAVEPLITVLKGKYPRPHFDPPKRATGILFPFAAAPDPHEIELDARCRAAGLLGKLKDGRAADALLAATQSADTHLRYQAALGLGELNDLRAVEPLCAALQSPDYVVRAEAASYLGQLGDQRAVNPLLVVLQKDGRTLPRWRATQALGQLGDPRAVPPMLNNLMELLELPATEWAPPNRDEIYEESIQITWTTCGYLLEALAQLGTAQTIARLEDFARRVPSQTIAEKARKCMAQIQARLHHR